jgi:hypothetical protein
MKDKLRTIVGGRYAEHIEQNNFPRGIEVLLKKAKVDLKFQRLFLDNPLAAARSIELNLNENEKKILSNTLKPVLKLMIERTFVPKHHARTFLTARTAAMIALVLSSAVVQPSISAATKGIRAAPEAQDSLYQLTIERMTAVQNALDQYKNDHGAYPSTDSWLNTDNPLSEYLLTSNLYDPWNRKLHYEAVLENEIIVSYKLESFGKNINSGIDNISCPIDTEKHSF